MQQQSPTRRELAFRNLGDAVDDARTLHRSGYLQAGQWDLAQICGHLADWMRFPKVM